MKLYKSTGILAAMLVAVMLSFSPTASATGSAFQLSGNAIAQCKGALPVYENGLRSRPLAIVNETNTTPSFVNCGLLHQSNSYGYNWIKFRLGNVGNNGANNTSVNVTTACTVIAGREGENATYYTVPTVTNIAPGTTREVTVTAANLGATGSEINKNVAIQCRLSKGATLTDIVTQFRHSN